MRRIQRRTLVTTLVFIACFANFIVLLKLLFTSTGHDEVQKYVFRDFKENVSRSSETEVVVKYKRGLVNTSKHARRNSDRKKIKEVWHQTDLTDIFISIKTTGKNHRTRLKVLLDTWIQLAINQTYVFTDTDDLNLQNFFPPNHVINTNCSSLHNRKALCCKMAWEYDMYMNTDKRWFCHVDDDTYVNLPKLVELLQKYNHTSDWYLGKPSLKAPIEVEDRANPGQKFAFWFATGGAGVCISKALALKMIPYAGGGKFMTSGEQIRLPDDCTVGYIINYILHKELTVIKEFHSHLEALGQIRLGDIKDQISFSFYQDNVRTNVVEINGFSQAEDPTRFHSIHCHLNPYLTRCVQLNQ